MNYYHIGIVALLFGTGELILGSATHGWLQVGMMTMVVCSYFLCYVCLVLHQEEENSYIDLKTKHS